MLFRSIHALHKLRFTALPDDPQGLMVTLGCLLKTREDRFQIGVDRVRQLSEGRRSVGVAEKSAQPEAMGSAAVDGAMSAARTAP